MAPGVRDGRGETTPVGRRRLVAGALLSLGAWALLQVVAPPERIDWSPAMAEAAERMAEGLEATRAHCREQGILVDPILDPNGSCLIGPQLTPLFTTQGQLEAKRTTLNPDLAGLLVHLLREAGVEEGGRVAIGASGSFPGLLLATLVAVEAMGAQPVTLLSLGSSSYGATRMELHLLDLHELWRREGVIQAGVGAVSLGGTDDVGLEFEPQVREGLTDQIRGMGLRLIQEAELQANVAGRMEIYGPVAVFVNVGGAQANMGVSSDILQVPPGLSLNLDAPDPSQRGVLFEMASLGIPVIHLLHIRGLALQYGLPWDPAPLPLPGESDLRTGAQDRGLGFWLLTGGYLSMLVLVFLFPATVRKRPE
jgi:poly-gamma-glutamate system protein